MLVGEATTMVADVVTKRVAEETAAGEATAKKKSIDAGTTKKTKLLLTKLQLTRLWQTRPQLTKLRITSLQQTRLG
jgi:hypothetical protein